MNYELDRIVTRASNEHHYSFSSESPFHRCSQAEVPLFNQLWDLMMQIENIGSDDFIVRIREESYCIHAGERKEMTPEHAEAKPPYLPDGDLYSTGT